MTHPALATPLPDAADYCIAVGHRQGLMEPIAVTETSGGGQPVLHVQCVAHVHDGGGGLGDADVSSTKQTRLTMVESKMSGNRISGQ